MASLVLLTKALLPMHEKIRCLTEQKRFMAREYRLLAPLQTQLFSLAASLSDHSMSSWYLYSLNKREQNDCHSYRPTSLAPSLRSVVLVVIVANRLRQMVKEHAQGVTVSARPALPTSQELARMSTDTALDAVVAAMTKGDEAEPAAAYAYSSHASGSDLAHALFRGRREHARRIKERGLILDRASDVQVNSVSLGRAVRAEYERSLAIGEGPGQPGSLHITTIKCALTSLARELNAAEKKLLELGYSQLGGGNASLLNTNTQSFQAHEHDTSQPPMSPFAEIMSEVGTTDEGTPEEYGMMEVVDGLERHIDELELNKDSDDEIESKHHARELVASLQAKAQELQQAVEDVKSKLMAARAALEERDEALRRERATTGRLQSELSTLRLYTQRLSQERDECEALLRSDDVSQRYRHEQTAVFIADTALKKCKEEARRQSSRCELLEQKLREVSIVAERSRVLEMKLQEASLRDESSKKALSEARSQLLSLQKQVSASQDAASNEVHAMRIHMSATERQRQMELKGLLDEQFQAQRELETTLLSFPHP
ncbi:unnamed protein product [Chrysoparadoxa australica]